MTYELPTPLEEDGLAQWLTSHTTTAFEGTDIEHRHTTRVYTSENDPFVEISTAHFDLTCTLDEAKSLALAILAAHEYHTKETA